MVHDGVAPDEVLSTLARSKLGFVPFDDDQAKLAAELLPRTRAKGLSLGDRACLALAIARGLPALTADRTWATLHLPIKVVLIR